MLHLFEENIQSLIEFFNNINYNYAFIFIAIGTFLGFLTKKSIKVFTFLLILFFLFALVYNIDVIALVGSKSNLTIINKLGFLLEKSLLNIMNLFHLSKSALVFLIIGFILGFKIA